MTPNKQGRRSEILKINIKIAKKQKAPNGIEVVEYAGKWTYVSTAYSALLPRIAKWTLWNPKT